MPQARPAARLAYHAAAERRASRASGERARDRTRRRRADYSNAPADFGKARSLTRLTATFGTMSACTPPRCRYRCTARRTVEDVVVVDGRNRKQSQGIKVRGDVLTTDPQTNFPIFGAMGFEVTQGLIIGKNTLLVERPSDILHLQAVSSVLRKQKRAFLDPAWAICPAGGIDKVPGSVGAAWQEWIQTEAWSRLAPSTRYKIWWEAWNKRIEPFFGDCAPDSITMKMIDEWRADMETVSGIDAAHKALKTFRAFWRVMQAIRYTQLTDPSKKVVNRAPRARHQRFGYGEAVRLAKGAWRAGYRGLACIIIVTWDSGFSPQDARTPLLGRTWGRAHGRVLSLPNANRRALRPKPPSKRFRNRSGNRHAGRQAPAPRYAPLSCGRDVHWRRGCAGCGREVWQHHRHSNVLFKTYNPVDLEKVRQADAARLEGRRRKNKG